MTTFKALIDEAVEMCGGVNELADRLGAHPGAITHARACRQPLSKEKIQALAELMEANPAELWELQEIANIPRRNPFLRVAQAATAAFVCVVLSVAPNDAKAIAIGANASKAVTGVYAHCRQTECGADTPLSKPAQRSQKKQTRLIRVWRMAPVLQIVTIRLTQPVTAAAGNPSPSESAAAGADRIMHMARTHRQGICMSPAA